MRSRESWSWNRWETPLASVEDRLKDLGVSLPEVPPPVAAYVPAVVCGDLVFLSGQIARNSEGGLLSPGKLGDRVSLEEGYAAARQCALQALAALRACIGDLDRVERVAKLTVFVAGAEGFDQQSVVANGASELLEQVFGDRGRHARSAVGVAGLPLGASVEVELIARIRSE